MLICPVPVAGSNYVFKWARSASGIGGTSTSVDSTGTDLIVIAMASGAAGPPTDNKSNAPYTSIVTSAAASDAGTSQLYYKANPTVGTGHIFTNYVASYPTSFIFGFSGVVTSPLIGTGTTGGGGSTNVTSIQPGSITPGFNNTLFVTGLVDNVSFTTVGINLGFIQPIAAILNTASNYAGAAGYLLQGAGAATNPTWTSDVGYPLAAGMACFKSVGS